MKQELMLVTGANGYVGGWIVKTLAAQGVPVRAMVRREESIKEVQRPGVEVVLASMEDSESLNRAVQGVYGVFHIAALFRAANTQRDEFFRVNAQGVKKLLDASIQAGVKRFVHCSTGGVLGDITDPPGSDRSPYAPCDDYQKSKVEGEKIALEYFRSGRIPGVVIRPAMVYGPGDTRNLKLFKMIWRRRFVCVGDGSRWVHFVDIRDLVQGFLLGMEHEEISGEVYTIAGERAVRQDEAFKLIAKSLGLPAPKLHLPAWPLQLIGSACEALCRPFGINPPIYRRRVDFFTKNRNFDVSKAVRELGYRPARTFEDEVQSVADWYREQGWLR